MQPTIHQKQKPRKLIIESPINPQKNLYSFPTPELLNKTRKQKYQKSAKSRIPKCFEDFVNNNFPCLNFHLVLDRQILKPKPQPKPNPETTTTMNGSQPQVDTQVDPILERFFPFVFKSPVDMFNWSDILYFLIPISLNNPLKCPICLDIPLNPRVAECGHTLCFSCLLTFSKSSTPFYCPICSVEWSLSDPIFDISLTDSEDSTLIIESYRHSFFKPARFVPHQSQFDPNFQFLRLKIDHSIPSTGSPLFINSWYSAFGGTTHQCFSQLFLMEIADILAVLLSNPDTDLVNQLQYASKVLTFSLNQINPLLISTCLADQISYVSQCSDFRVNLCNWMNFHIQGVQNLHDENEFEKFENIKQKSKDFIYAAACGDRKYLAFPFQNGFTSFPTFVSGRIYNQAIHFNIQLSQSDIVSKPQYLHLPIGATFHSCSLSLVDGFVNVGTHSSNSSSQIYYQNSNNWPISWDSCIYSIQKLSTINSAHNHFSQFLSRKKIKEFRASQLSSLQKSALETSRLPEKSLYEKLIEIAGDIPPPKPRQPLNLSSGPKLKSSEDDSAWSHILASSSLDSAPVVYQSAHNSVTHIFKEMELEPSEPAPEPEPEPVHEPVIRKHREMNPRFVPISSKKIISTASVPSPSSSTPQNQKKKSRNKKMKRKIVIK